MINTRRNCNLELHLLPYSYPTDDDNDVRHNMMEESSHSPQNQQQLTIFYNGRVCVCDATEFQARAILMLASREMDERVKTPTGSEPASPTLQTQLHSPSTGLSMKRSLQRFLQKRKSRKILTSPYH